MPSDDTRAFLEAILPAEGLKCALVLDPDRSYRRQYFYNTVAELAEAVLRLDAELASTKHGAVYHACASFRSPSRRGADALSARSLWFDIDVGGPGKYPDARTGAEALVAFLKDAGLPLPLLVGSGTGLHGYWPLREPLEPGEWQRYASGLKQLFRERSLLVDATRTADIASILRPVGTTHRKGEPRLVRAVNVVDVYAIEQFAGLLVDGRQHRLRGEPGRLLDAVRSGTDLHAAPQPRSITALTNLSTPQPVDFDVLADRCGQMGAFRDTGGQLSEPLWYAGLGVLAKCLDGDVVGHAWSKGHSGYDPKETQSKLDRAKKLTGPPTCEHFKSLNGAVCVACPFKVTTPLDTLFLAPVNTFVTEQPAEKPYKDFSIYSYLKDGSLCIKTESNDGKVQFRKLTSFPIYFCSVHTGELRTSFYTYLMRHWLPQEGWKEVEISAKSLFGSQGISLLAEAGVVVHDAEGFRKFARESVDMLNAEQKLSVQYEQFGWKHDNRAFLYGDRLYSTGTPAQVACAPEVRLRSQWLAPRQSGSLEGWKEAADGLFGGGSEGQSFVVLASFAAPLMRFLEDQEGGAIISMVTNASGAGKSTSLAGASTVWATNPRALALTTIDTKVSKGLALGVIGNLPMFYDEFRSRDPELVREFVEMFTNGRDKMRGSQDGQLVHTAASWQTFLFTASNASLISAIQSEGRSDAPAFRILEFPVQSGGEMNPIQAGTLKKKLEANAGHAGDAFLRYLVQPSVLEWVQRKLPEITTEFYEKGGFGREHRFWVRALGAVGTAALIVKHLNLVSFSPDRVMKWALHHFIEMKRTGLVANPDHSQMITLLSQFLNEHILETLVMRTEWRAGLPPQEPVYAPRNRLSVRRNADTGQYLIVRSVLREWLARHEITLREFQKELSDAMVMVNTCRLVSLGAGTGTPGGQIPCVIIDGRHPRLTGIIQPVSETPANDVKRSRG